MKSKWKLIELKKTRGRQAEKGGALIEMSLLLPFIAMLLVGTIDLTRVFHLAIALENAASVGAHYGTRTSIIYLSGIEEAAYDDLTDISGVNVTASCEQPVGSPVDCGGAAVAQNLYVRVVASKTFNTLIAYPGIPSSVPLQKEAIMRVR